MYPSVRSKPPVSTPPESGRRGRVLSQNLLALGFCSFFTDISSEMVTAVVPLFLTAGLGFGFAGVALYEAAFQATSAFFRIWGGSIADSRQSHKKTAATGYTISAATRVGLVASVFVTAIPTVPFLLADRIGKGIRTAPRDALISLSTVPSRLSAAFGVHRAMDTAGAMLGPLIAAFVLHHTTESFDAVFVVSAMFAAIGVAVIWMFAQEKPQRAPSVRRPRFAEQWRDVVASAGVVRIALSVLLLGLVTVGDAFIYLMIQRNNNLSAEYFPLLFVGTALAYLILAVPFGHLADRIGTRTVFLAGNAVLILLYLVIGFSDLGFAASVFALALLGTYYAATDGVIPAMVSRLVPSQVRASGIAFVTVVIAVSRMISAGIFVLLFESIGRTSAMVVLAIVMAAAIAIGTKMLTEPEPVNV